MMRVHETHCCKEHGCKYAEHDCPVVTGETKQKYPCELCGSLLSQEGLEREFELFRRREKAKEISEIADKQLKLLIESKYNIIEAVSWYANEESRVQKDLGCRYITTIYEAIYPISLFDSYSVCNVIKDSILIQCRYCDQNGEIFKWNIALPVKKELTTNYLKQHYIRIKERKDKKEIEKKQREIERLQNQIEKMKQYNKGD